ncbi:hypothetical protein HBI56_221670 [Parastagonospora nodorum]|nr:hypothetical protein HBI09_215450 [Parastagonospora nodorum]KAH4216913.1 hypothetical protein HBI06_222560 [Parastagonospora nodorum]KAH4226168.1 hypothetical protein HBI05_224230 [Parastagonospora nodorum]KAH4335507.1 hypothetical protein HBH98_234620 [Parastagonospora nodorum]KAH4358207.1 hypothetical protein HBH97_219190 [Parastagonospora nodorum]
MSAHHPRHVQLLCSLVCPPPAAAGLELARNPTRPKPPRRDARRVPNATSATRATHPVADRERRHNTTQLTPETHTSNLGRGRAMPWTTTSFVSTCDRHTSQTRHAHCPLPLGSPHRSQCFGALTRLETCRQVCSRKLSLAILILLPG